MRQQKRLGPWWHWAILSAVFAIGAVPWIVDNDFGARGYLLAVFGLTLSASAAHSAWTQFRRRHSDPEGDLTLDASSGPE